MEFLTYLAIALVALVVYRHYQNKKKKVNLPGPWGIPVLGSAFRIEARLHTVFQKWARQYGDMYYVELGKDRIVVISDTKLVRELFAQDIFTGRNHMPEFSLFENDQPRGLIISEGVHWEQLRRFTLRQLRDFGFGKSSMEALIMDEVEEFNEVLRASDGKPLDNLKQHFSLAVVNALWSIISGERYSHDDPKLRALLQQMTDTEKGRSYPIFCTVAQTFYANFYTYFMPELSGYNAVRKGMEDMKTFVTKAITSHKDTYRGDGSPRDFIDVYLKEMRSGKDPNSAFYKDVGEENLTNSISDLFAAGSDTSSTTLSWAILYLTKWPKVQKKFREEIKYVTENNRPVSLTDKLNMPYTQAVIEEVLRLSSIAPFAVPHRVIADTEVRGVKIPKGTVIFANTYFIHHNPKIWDDAYNFKPERFLSEDGKIFKKNENMMAFSVGKRACLGETLARDTIFLFLTNTFQQWNISFDPNEPEPPIETKVGASMNPEDYRIIAKKF